MTKLIDDIPTGFYENLEYRSKILKAAQGNRAYQQGLIKQCEHDIIFFLNVFCIAEGTLVLTDKGPVPIEDVTPSHLVWDGSEWVSQDGALFRGEKEVIDAYGISLTNDHKVWTKNGWQIAGCRYDREEVRPPAGYETRAKLQERPSKVALRVRLRKRKARQRGRTQERCSDGMRMPDQREGDAWNDSHSDVPLMGRHEGQVQEPQQPLVEAIRGQGDKSLPKVDGFVRELLRGHGGATRRNDTGANRQQWKLRAKQRSLGNAERAGKQHAKKQANRNISWKDDDFRGCKRSRLVNRGYQVQGQDRNHRRGPVRSSDTRPTRVYDLINCGPKQAFTVIDKDGGLLLVHNCFCYEPRPRRLNGKLLPRKIPFIAWEHQVPVIRQIFECLGERDIVVEKSRGEGASWIGTLLATHGFLFIKGESIGLVSKDEKSADDPDNPDSLMWKICSQLEWLPSWMSGTKGKDYKRDITNHALKNLRNGSTINAFAATGNVASGGRKGWVLQDELSKYPRPQDRAAMASTQPVTDCRLIVSTPLGATGAFYDAVHEDSNALKLRLCWEDNPTRNRGLYRFVDGKPVAEDPVNNPLPPEYDPPNEQILSLFARLRAKGYILENRVRSPWYDNECDRPGASPQLVAQEYDRDYGGSSHLVFTEDFLNAVGDTSIPEIEVGDIDFKVEDLTEVRFDKNAGGPLKLWMPLDFSGHPPAGKYVLGCDISNGLGGTHTSNSVIVGIDSRTGDQVLEFASRTIPPQDFADYCIALARWLGDAFLAWEANGPGQSFSARVKKRGYGRVMLRQSKSRSGKRDQQSLGWWTDDNSKRVMFADVRSAVMSKQLSFRSFELKKEFANYVYKNGKPEHALIAEANDDSKGVSHGDRVIAAAIANQAFQQNPVEKINSENDIENAPPNTFAARHAEYLRSLRDEEEENW